MLTDQNPLRYRSPHIRPLAVSPLIDPERAPNPWGFFVSERRIFPPLAPPARPQFCIPAAADRAAPPSETE